MGDKRASIRVLKNPFIMTKSLMSKPYKHLDYGQHQMVIHELNMSIFDL